MHPPVSIANGLAELEATIYGRDATRAWSGRKLAEELREFRRELTKGDRDRAATSPVLPELNPPRIP